MGPPQSRLICLVEGEESADLGAEVSCGLAPQVRPECFSPHLSLRVIPSGPLVLGKESLTGAWAEGPGGEASAVLVAIWGLPGYAHGVVT